MQFTVVLSCNAIYCSTSFAETVSVSVPRASDVIVEETKTTLTEDINTKLTACLKTPFCHQTVTPPSLTIDAKLASFVFLITIVATVRTYFTVFRIAHTEHSSSQA
jgi:hypothetical protein